MNYSKLAAVFAAGLMAAVPGTGIAQDTPTQPVEILVGATPGGGYDRLARSIQTIIEEKNILDVPLQISYHPGGGGSVAWAATNRTPGDMSKLSIFSPNIVTGEVLGAAGQGFENHSILGMLVFEDGCFAVNPSGTIKNAEDLIAAMKNDPSKVRFSFAVSAGNQWHVAMAKFADAVGSDITKVRSTVFDSGGKAVAALLGGHVDVSVSGCAQFAEQHEAGDLKVIAVSAEERVGGVLSDVPTWIEQGHNVVWSAWRGVLGPKDLTEGQISFWEDRLEAVVADPAWKPIAEENYWRTSFKGSAETNELLASEREEYRNALKTLGLIE